MALQRKNSISVGDICLNNDKHDDDSPSSLLISKPNNRHFPPTLNIDVCENNQNVTASTTLLSRQLSSPSSNDGSVFGFQEMHRPLRVGGGIRRSRPASTGASYHLAPPSPRRSMRILGSDRSNSHADNISTVSAGSLACYYKAGEDVEDTVPCLVLSRMEKIPLMDFSSEVRASLDIEMFLKEATLLLNMTGTTLEEIIDKMLRATFSDKMPDPKQVDSLMAEAKKAMFMEINIDTYTYQRLAKTIKGVFVTENEGLATDQTWICAMCSLASVHKRHLAIARLETPMNLGRSSESVYFIILAITPTKEKGTKSEIELGRTFSTLITDMEVRQQLLFAQSEKEFKEVLRYYSRDLAEEQRIFRRRSLKVKEVMNQAFLLEKTCFIGSGMASDFKKRLKVYPSDYVDGVKGNNTMRKLISATTFLYFACLLPSIAFGVLNSTNTDGKIDVQRVIISQTFAGIGFSLFGGQPLIVMLTTAPLALYTKVIHSICKQYSLDFYAMFGCVGLFNAFFLFIYSIFDCSKLMKWSTRSTEEIFALFVSIAFIVDGSRDIYKEFQRHYFCPSLKQNESLAKVLNYSLPQVSPGYGSSHNVTMHISCNREVSILYLLLTIGTVWLAVQVFNFTKTPFLNAAKREMLADFALPVSVLVMSFVGSYLFNAIRLDPFHTSRDPFNFKIIPFFLLDWKAILGAVALAFPLSLIFFMDQNISSAMVNAPTNKLKKSAAYHWDLFVVGVINAFLSLFALPWVHGALPHSPLHVKALADLEERIDSGNVVHQIIVRVRETRLTGLLSHCFIGLSLLMLPTPLSYIPVAVLDGLFIHMAVTSLYDNQLFERVLLLFTEQSAYPPSHYLRRVPQRKLHLFTFLQLIQLILLCILGFGPSPYMKMGFPLVLLLQLPVRHLVITKIIDEKYLEALDKAI